jgi:hypothetical protein
LPLSKSVPGKERRHATSALRSARAADSCALTHRFCDPYAPQNREIGSADQRHFSVFSVRAECTTQIGTCRLS